MRTVVLEGERDYVHVVEVNEAESTCRFIRTYHPSEARHGLPKCSHDVNELAWAMWFTKPGYVPGWGDSVDDWWCDCNPDLDPENRWCEEACSCPECMNLPYITRVCMFCGLGLRPGRD